MEPRDEVFAAIVEIAGRLGDGFDGRCLRPDETRFKVYGLDSLHLIRLAALVEDHFGIAITETELLSAESVAQLIDLVMRKTGRTEDVAP